MKLYLHTTKGRHEDGLWQHLCTMPDCGWHTPWHGVDERSHYAHQAADHTIAMSAHLNDESHLRARLGR